MEIFITTECHCLRSVCLPQPQLENKIGIFYKHWNSLESVLLVAMLSVDFCLCVAQMFEYMRNLLN